MKYFISIVVSIIIVFGGWYYWAHRSSSSAETDKTVVFTCDAGKSITATFHLPSDTSVSLALSDGRAMTLPHAVSADGARYANADESVVFWNVGNTAFITEGLDAAATTTYANCTDQDIPIPTSLSASSVSNS